MGSCLSKKSTNSSCAATTAVEKPPPEQTKSNAQVVVEKKKVGEEETVKKEIFVIKHRKSHEIDRKSVGEEKCEVKKGAEVSEMAKHGCSANNAMNNVGVLGLGPGSGVLAAAPVRTSSCTKEEVDAILIQCGRLSRSSSTGKAALSGSLGSGENGNSVQKGRKYSGSKRSYDFDHENGRGGETDQGCEDNPVVDDDNGVGVGVLVVGERSNRHRQRQRQSRSVGSPSSKGRRRTPSRERDQAQQRSGSRERVSNGSGRRVSRSPGRRSESPITNSSGVTATAANSSSSSSANPNNNSSNNGGGGGSSNRPGKMVSVPATVSSMAMVDKSNNNAGGGTETISASAVKRIQVKRNVGCDAAAVVVGSRTAASPRARSPARVNARAVSSENQNTNSAQNMQQQQQQQPLSLSRSNSRKAEQSPYRRNPLGEIDTNVVIAVPHNTSQAPVQKLNTDDAVSEKRVKKGIVDKNPQAINNNVAVNVVGSGSEILKSTTSHGVTRSRSSRLSRDLDINPEALSNAAPSSYTALLLEDIQNFHQKNSNTPAFTLPACVSKACSILEAVADLNSSTGSNFSAAAFSDDKKRIPTMTTDQFSKLCNHTGSFGAQQKTGKKGVEKKDPFVQSEVVVVGDDDDLMEPSFHKYVTVRRGGTLGGEDMEEQESSGSNSFVSGQQHWTSSSSWEPNSADSTDCWTSSSSRSNCREDSRSPAVVPFQRFALSEPGYYDADEARRRLSGKKRDSDLQQNGIGKGGSRLGSRGLQSSVPAAAAAN